MGWSTQMAPMLIGNPDRPELGEKLTNSFCRTDPEIAKAFARVPSAPIIPSGRDCCRRPCLQGRLNGRVGDRLSKKPNEV
jgi:hypothetical protein